METLELLFETHFPGCEVVGPTEQETRGVLTVSRSNEEINNIVTTEKIAWAINTFKPYKSAGPDGIFPAMLQNTSVHGLSIIRDIFVGCLKLGYIPKEWREVRVIFIPKAGKASHSRPKDYRPISLSSFLLKTLERLLDLYLRNSIDTRIISNAQHAYLKGKSVESALHEVVSVIEKGLEYKDYTLAAFLDIEGAFNNIKIEAIKESLISLNVDNLLIEWIINMLSSRIINSSLGDGNIRKTVTRGTPQGGVLSPLLWLLAVNQILRQFDNQGRKVVAYADDVVLLVSGKFLPTISNVMESALGELSTWAKERGLGVNPDKTELVLYSRRRKIENFRLPKLNGVDLKLSTEAKYLGVILDSKLLWNRNIEERVKKGLNAYYFCRNSIGKTWGLKPRTVYWIYTSIVRPVATYGCSVWWEALEKSSYLNKLNKVQRCASMGITGTCRSTPQAALDIMLNILSIDSFVKGTAARNLLRLKESGLIKCRKKGHTRVLQQVGISGLESDSSELTDYKVKEILFNVKPTIDIPNRDRWKDRERLFEGFAVFTDGSKMDVGTGSGVYLVEKDIRLSFRLSDDCSVFQAEIHAILEAAKLISGNLEECSEVTIYVDSQAAIKALQSHSVTSRLVLNCMRVLSDLSLNYRVRLCWVPGHCNIKGNEIADELARIGSGLDPTLRTLTIKPPICHLFGVIKNWMRDETAKSWFKNSECKIAKATWPYLDAAKTDILLDLGKNSLRKTVSMLTGHCPVRYRLNMWDSNVPDICRLCEEQTETVEHILCHCPMLQHLRLRFLGSRFYNTLQDIQQCKLTEVIGFILKINWLK